MEVNVYLADYVVIGLYFVGILFCGMWFGRNTKSTKDFFFGGQRFAWWLVAVSCVATLVGSYSFLQYSESAFNFGISATMCYTNDWFIIPLFILGWLPIIYFSRVTSIPEYFQRRFDERTRMAALFIILVYLIGYIGINLFTIGVAINGMLGINIYITVVLVAVVSAIYMHGGGQTSVIMTDLIQGFILILAGFLVFAFGLAELAKHGIPFWESLPAKHKLPFADFNTPPKFHTLGIFWNDAITASIAFYCMNQGILMRFMSAKSVRDGKKAIAVVVLLFMPIAAISVCNAGWIGRVMVDSGILPANIEAKYIFVKVANFCPPGVFGLVMAALVAALMSTIDTYITAVSAIVVNDIWRSKLKPGRKDSYYLGVARYAAIAATLLGISLVPFFNSFQSIFQAFSHFCAIVVPPMIVVITLAILWKRFTPAAAFWTLVLGFAINLVSIFFPMLVKPFSQGSDGYMFSLNEKKYSIQLDKGEVSDDLREFFAANRYVLPKDKVDEKTKKTKKYMGVKVNEQGDEWVIRDGKQGQDYLVKKRGDKLRVSLVGHNYTYMRAFFGTVISLFIGLIITFFTRPRKEEEIAGLVISTIPEGQKLFKGGIPSEEGVGIKIRGDLEISEVEGVSLCEDDMKSLCASPGDCLYVSDARGWLGGLRAVHVKASAPHRDKSVVRVSKETVESGNLLLDRPVAVEKIM